MIVQPIESVLDQLERYGVLASHQQAAVSAEDANAFTDPVEFVKHLIRKELLTIYQGRKLLQGRGADLVVGQYVILDKIGEGAMGRVYKALQRRLDRVVALKILRSQLLNNETAVRRFQREARAAAQLAHPNIVRLFDADQVEQVYFLAMEYVDGIDLSRLIKELKERGESMEVARACEIIRQAAVALQHAHDQGLIHRDIKPSNILVTHGLRLPDGRVRDAGIVKVLDMGLARPQVANLDPETSGSLTQDGTVVGTPDYMSPEQGKNSRTVDHRADLYSLGCTLFFLLTGRALFDQGSAVEKLLQHQQDIPPDVRGFRPEVPVGVVGILQRLLAKNPDDRFSNAHAVAEALVPFADPNAEVPDGLPVVGGKPSVVPRKTPAGEFDLPLPATTSFDESATAPEAPQAGSVARRRPRWHYLVAILGTLLILLLVRRWLNNPASNSAKPPPPPKATPPPV